MCLTDEESAALESALRKLDSLARAMRRRRNSPELGKHTPRGAHLLTFATPGAFLVLPPPRRVNGRHRCDVLDGLPFIMTTAGNWPVPDANRGIYRTDYLVLRR